MTVVPFGFPPDGSGGVPFAPWPGGLAGAQALYRRRYEDPDAIDQAGDLRAALGTERHVGRNRREYRCAPCGRVVTNYGGLCSHLRGAGHVAALYGVDAAAVKDGLVW